MDIQGSSGLILNAIESNINIGLLIAMIVLVFLSAFFSMTETVYSTTNTVRLTVYAGEGKKSAQKALWIAEHYDRTLTTILVGNNLVNITLATNAPAPAIKAYFVSPISRTVVVYIIDKQNGI